MAVPSQRVTKKALEVTRSGSRTRRRWPLWQVALASVGVAALGGLTGLGVGEALRGLGGLPRQLTLALGGVGLVLGGLGGALAALPGRSRAGWADRALGL